MLDRPRVAGRGSDCSPLRELARCGAALATVSISVILGTAALAGLAVVENGGLTPGGAAIADAAFSTSTPDVVRITRGNVTGARGSAALTIGDLEAITRSVSDVAVISRVVADAQGTVVADGMGSAPVEGVDPSFAQIAGNAVTHGVFFTAQDGEAANRVAVVGQTAAANLFPDGQSPVGQTIRIRNLPFTVVGVLGDESDPRPNASVLVPFQTGQVRLFGTRSAYSVLLQVGNGGQATAVRGQVESLLRQRHKMAAGQADDFTIRTDSTSPADATQTRLQAIVRALELVQQFTCGAKALCAQRLT